MKTDIRRPNLSDLNVLVLATALAMATLRWLYPDLPWSNVLRVMRYELNYHRAIPGLVSISAELVLLLMPAVGILCSALLGLAMMGPRPRRWRYFWSQPGKLACLLVSVLTLTVYLASWVSGRFMGSRPTDLNEWPMALAGVAVVVSWTTLGLTGRWRPEQGWIDRVGRGIGITVATAAFCRWLTFAFYLWLFVSVR